VSAKGYGFDILTAGYVPAGYKWESGAITKDAGPDDSTSYVGYKKPLGTDEFDFSITAFSKRNSFKPPADCGYFLGPVNTDP
jgi:hypothetical protein